jgi:hypothetical protein
MHESGSGPSGPAGWPRRSRARGQEDGKLGIGAVAPVGRAIERRGGALRKEHELDAGGRACHARR